MSQNIKNMALATNFARAERKVWPGVQPFPGNGVPRVVVGVFDPSANTAERTAAAHGLGVRLPKGAIVTNFWWEVKTTFTSAADTATIAVHLESAGDLFQAVAINFPMDLWDAGRHRTDYAWGEAMREFIVKSTYNPTANAAERTVAAHPFGPTIPSGCVVTGAYYKVTDTLHSPTTGAGVDKATIALHLQTAGDLKAATAIEAAGDCWDEVKAYACTAFDTTHPILLTSDQQVKATVAVDPLDLGTLEVYTTYQIQGITALPVLTDERELTATVGVQPLTAGKALFFVEYIQSLA